MCATLTARVVAVFRPEPMAVSICKRSSVQPATNDFPGGAALTCIEDNRLTCDANTLERGRPRCRLTGE
jgi:hypothetical protein